MKTIIEGEKYRFNIEIDLSEQQLKFLCEYAGDDNYEHLFAYKNLTANGTDKPVTIHPSFAMGLGADINSILSLGFEALSLMDSEIKTKFSESDLKYHPFMCKRNEIISIESNLIDCEVLSSIKPITQALDEDGNLIDLKS
ncbi:hypothetical protein ACI6PS_02385 [Flavobacterium sp. PLA-1-15]|uniref:hypothetical protein n=1 Tax=Flavobacterium sp. PLA-1-15 TaxID=3380533 RepID=UPI003B81C248